MIHFIQSTTQLSQKWLANDLLTGDFAPLERIILCPLGGEHEMKLLLGV
jgi:hypothetical protein